ncbi:hypothetical protein [Streptomyces collinus]
MGLGSRVTVQVIDSVLPARVGRGRALREALADDRGEPPASPGSVVAGPR